jgi:hypothetical protein
MTMVEIKLLQRYRVDRQEGQTAAGPEQLVILILKAANAPEMAYAISKVDAMKIAIQMQLAAQDAQTS